MDFAPYQSSPPEATRKPLLAGRSNSLPSFFRPSSDYSPPLLPTSVRSYTPVPESTPARNPGSPPEAVHWQMGGGISPAWMRGRFGNTRETVEQFETSLPIRLDYEAMLAYTALPPVGSVLLLILEHKSDYVRFHAWQGALLFTALAVLHLAVSFSRSLSWGLFVVDMVSIAWLSWCAYRDADTLDRWEVPWFGSLANSILEDE